MQAEIWTKVNCGFCVKAKKLLLENGVKFTEYVIDNNNEIDLDQQQIRVTREQLLEKAPAARSVPQIWLNGNYIGGYTELAAFWEVN